MQKFLHYVLDNFCVNSAGEVNVKSVFFAANTPGLYFYFFFLMGHPGPKGKVIIKKSRYTASLFKKKIAQPEMKKQSNVQERKRTHQYKDKN
jgi:hypothetical protein